MQETHKNDCIFCEIIKGNIGSKKILENEHSLAIYDINPQAPIHVLIITKEHLEDFSKFTRAKEEIIMDAMKSIKEVADRLDLNKKGYRLIVNSGEDAGQLINHLHFHLLAGKKLGPKMIQ